MCDFNMLIPYSTVGLHCFMHVLEDMYKPLNFFLTMVLIQTHKVRYIDNLLILSFIHHACIVL